MKPIIIALAGGLAFAQPVLAAAPLAPDARIRSIDYEPDRIVNLTGRLSYQLTVEFASDERIENVAIGDALGWQVTPNRRANMLFLKPLDDQAATNMTVVTSHRRYLFDLSVAGRAAQSSVPYAVRFIYPPVEQAVVEAPLPPPPPEPEKPPTVANSAYSVTGDTAGAPVRIFDDGAITYFEWAPGAAVPAIFAVGADGAESVVNYTIRAGLVAVDQIAPRFSLRNGRAVTTIVNTAQPQPRGAAR